MHKHQPPKSIAFLSILSTILTAYKNPPIRQGPSRAQSQRVLCTGFAVSTGDRRRSVLGRIAYTLGGVADGISGALGYSRDGVAKPTDGIACRVRDAANGLAQGIGHSTKCFYLDC